MRFVLPHRFTIAANPRLLTVLTVHPYFSSFCSSYACSMANQGIGFAKRSEYLIVSSFSPSNVIACLQLIVLLCILSVVIVLMCALAPAEHLIVAWFKSFTATLGVRFKNGNYHEEEVEKSSRNRNEKRQLNFMCCTWVVSSGTTLSVECHRIESNMPSLN